MVTKKKVTMMATLTTQAIADYNRMVASANKRLQRLEKLSTQKGYEGVKNWAYRLAIADIKALRGSGKTRFPTVSAKSAGLTGKEASALLLKMRRAEKAIQSFESLPTSTKTGIKRAYEKQAKSFSEGVSTEDHKIEFTVKQLAVAFESGLWSMLKDSGFGSGTTRKIIATIKENAKDLQKLREQGKAMRFKGDTDGYGDRINQWLSGNREAARALGRYLNSV
jgi:hypothetical protein